VRSVSLSGGPKLIDETASPIDEFGLNAAIGDLPEVDEILERLLRHAVTPNIRGNSHRLRDKPKTDSVRSHNDATHSGEETRVTTLG
jgi:hypothetical protein